MKNESRSAVALAQKVADDPQLQEEIRHDPLVSRRLTKPVDVDRGTARQPNFNVAIIYEAVAEGKRAKRFIDQLAAEVRGERILNLHLWNFQVLKIPEIRNVAARAAAAADIVILSLSGTKALPQNVKEWIEMWTWLIDGGTPALIALFAAENGERSSTCAYLGKAVSRKQLDFLSLART